MSDEMTGHVRRRLDGWKEIASHLRPGLSPRTAQRWEDDEGLPVYREGVKVFAYTDELDRWRSDRTVAPLAEAPPSVAPNLGKRLSAMALVVALLIAVCITAVLWAVWPLPDSPVPAVAGWGRLLARATSEGNSPSRIGLKHDADFLAVTPDGQKVYATGAWSRFLSIVQTNDRTVKTLLLPRDGGALAMSPDGRRLHIGSGTSGLMILDTKTDQLLPEIVKTGGTVYNMAITPHGDRLFLAMGRKGLWRLLTATGVMTQVTPRICPEYVEIDSAGRRLYVSYQCREPKGHDSVEIFDVDRETSLGSVTGPPMVGGHLAPSPDGQLLAVDAEDACQNLAYDHRGCPSVPSQVVHFLRLSDRQFVKTIATPVWSGNVTRFIDSTRLLLLGWWITVMDTSNYIAVEKWERKPDFFRASAFDWSRRKAYIGIPEGKGILVLEAEKPECSGTEESRVSFYPGDGVLVDTLQNGATLDTHGDLTFGPGRVGQAFVLDGQSTYLKAQSLGHYRFGFRDSSVALYVKFTGADEVNTILDRTSSDEAFLARLSRRKDGYVSFEFRPRGSTAIVVVSKTPMVTNRWYHLVITKNDDAVGLYVNGTRQARTRLGGYRSEVIGDQDIPLYLGATKGRRYVLCGKLDEVSFYNRALTADEVRRLYDMRETGPCRM